MSKKMNSVKVFWVILFGFLMVSGTLSAQERRVRPVDPQRAPEYETNETQALQSNSISNQFVSNEMMSNDSTNVRATPERSNENRMTEPESEFEGFLEDLFENEGRERSEVNGFLKGLIAFAAVFGGFVLLILLFGGHKRNKE